MSKHEKAVELIDSRIAALVKSSSGFHRGEASMAVEVAYALGAIDTNLHRHYVARLNKIIEREQVELMRKMGVTA